MRGMQKIVASAFIIISMVLGLLPVPVARALACPCTIWPNTTPANLTNSNDGQSLELGVKFRADVDGWITGVRFYKSTANTGTHTGSLWKTNGTKLATATFSSESASGWQQVTFAAPVAVTAGTTYVASYFSPTGAYSDTVNYFAGSATINAPLRALKNGTSGPNGVYKYGTSGFPTSSWNASNYWVDVVFTDTAPDTTAPTVTGVTPANNTTSVAIDSNVTATFSEAMDTATISGATFELRDPANAVIPAVVTYDAPTRTATLNPNANLAQNTTYTVRVRGDGTDPRVKDVAGNALASDYTWSFGTVAPPPSLGNSVLVVTSGGNQFSKYYTEILRAEGINSFTTADISSITSASLAPYSVVILGEMALSDAQVTTLSDWVNAGGNLVAMRPDAKLNSLLGLSAASPALSDAYMLVNTSGAPGAGITSQTMQYHGTANRYTLNGASSVATLYSDATTSTTNPAVSLRSVGTNGGQAAAFAYDLAKSVVYTRQGNPAWAGDERDGSGPIRSDDLFFGAKTGDVQPDWVNLDKVAIPQADEQQRLLANTIQYIQQDRTPVAKWWYFPKGQKAVLVMAGDDHGTLNGTENSFNQLIANSPAGCSVANWECYRSTAWVYTAGGLTDAKAVNYHNQGFDIGSHVSTGCANWTPQSLEDTFVQELSDFHAAFPDLPAQTGNRTHCIPWSDWATQPKVELNHDIRMDMNYYYWPGSWVQNRPGFMTGSGLPMRFADLDGTMIDVYQQASHLVNENGVSYPQGINTQLDRALGPEGYYGAFGTHYDFSDSFDTQLLNSAKARGVPLVSVQQMLDWTDGRNNSTFGTMTWSGNTLNFSASVDAKTGTMLRGMLPILSAKGSLSGLTLNGNPLSYTVDTIKGITYAFFQGATGQYAASYAIDTTAPTVSTTVPAANATGVDITKSVTATFSEAVDPATISGTTFQLKDSASNTVNAAVSYNSTTKVATLDPTANLSYSSVYTATVKGGPSGVKDIAGNALAADYSWSFTTVSGPVCPCSIWSNAAAPTLTNLNDGQPIESGVKFQADINGFITGIRFYKGSGDTGTHTGTLWSSTGTQLATASFSGETSSGWQQVTFAAPVAVTAGTTYVASYFSSGGYYSATSNYFTAAVDNPPLHALADGASGGNGLFKYGPSGFPTSSFGANNYWVDVVFTP